MSKEAQRISVVTGGAGFIGSHLARALVASGSHVIVYDNLSSALNGTAAIQDLIDEESVTFIKGDVRDRDALEHAIDADTSIVYHLAADPSVKDSVDDPLESFDQNVTGTMTVLEAMRAKNIEKMVFASSGGTLYGDVDSFPIAEEEALRPVSPYGASKAAVEMYLSAYAASYSMKIVSTRYANIYGPGSNHGVMFDFYHKLVADTSKLVILGDGKQSKSYLYVDDCVEATMKLGEWLDGQAPGTYEYFNLGTPGWITVTELAEVMVDVMGLENVSFEYTGGSRGWVGDVPKNLLDVKKVKQAIGWESKVEPRTGILRYLESLKG